MLFTSCSVCDRLVLQRADEGLPCPLGPPLWLGYTTTRPRRRSEVNLAFKHVRKLNHFLLSPVYTCIKMSLCCFVDMQWGRSLRTRLQWPCIRRWGFCCAEVAAHAAQLTKPGVGGNYFLEHKLLPVLVFFQVIYFNCIQLYRNGTQMPYMNVSQSFRAVFSRHNGVATARTVVSLKRR